MTLVTIAVMIAVVMVVAVVVISLRGCEGDAAEDLGKFGLADDGELLLDGLRSVGIGQIVGDGYKAVGVGSYVAVTADGGGDAVDGGLAVVVAAAGDVADAAGCGCPAEGGVDGVVVKDEG